MTQDKEQVKKCPQEILDKLDNCSGCVELKDDPLGGTHQIGTKQHPCLVCTKDHYPFCHQVPKECLCACHENKLHKPYEHDTKCCEYMNGFVPPKEPEQ